MVKLFRVLILIYAFCVHSMWCQNTTTTSCRPGDIRCTNNANGKEGDSSNSTNDSTTTNETKSPPTLTESLRGRAMNFTSAFQDGMRDNGLEAASSVPTSKPNVKEHSIDDVSIDEMDNEYSLNLTDQNLTNLMSSMTLFNDMMNAYQTPKNLSTCIDRDNKVFKLGEKFNRGCDETCQCLKNGVVCSQLCKPPLHTKGRNKNSNCTEVPVEGNSCCATLSCPPRIDLDTEPVEGCVYKNKTYKRGKTFEDGCESICTCGTTGRISCENRCPERNETEKCVLVTDPHDSCCKILLCDVEEHNVNKMDTTASDDGLSSNTEDNQITSVKLLNSSSIILTFAERSKDCNVEMSTNGIDWENVKCSNGVVSSLEPGKKYRFRLKHTVSNKVEITIPSQNHTLNSSCEYRGKTHKIGEEFHDGCRALCVCEVTGIECALIECPTDFGLDVLDPQCLDWETYPVNFVPSPPLCCPEKVQCRNNGSCVYNGEWFPNSAELPAKVTGCKERCYCELNKVTCQERCRPVPMPPTDLPCPPGRATLARSSEDECCSEWICPSSQTGNENITSMNKEYVTNILGTNITSKQKPQHILPTTAPNTYLLHNRTDESQNNNNVSSKKEAYPGPFSPQYFLKNENMTSEQNHQFTKKPNQEILIDLLTPFHLEKFASQIEKDLQSNVTNGNKKAKKPIKTHFKPTEEEEGDTEDEDYDEKSQDDDLFTDIFNSKNKNKNAPAKHPFWPAAHPEIPELVKAPSSYENKSPSLNDKESIAEIPPSTVDFPKKHNAEKDNLYINKKKPQDDKIHEVKVSEDTPQQFIPYAHIPYNIPDNIFPNMNSAGSKYPAQQEIIIHQGQNSATSGFNHKFKPPPIQDPNQSEDYLHHMIDSDAYPEDQIRQNLHYQGQQEVPQQFQNVVKLNKGGIRGQLPNIQSINTEDILTHLQHETNNNNNAHLPNILPGPISHQNHQTPNLLHNFNFQNYQDSLSSDQISHPLLLHPELNKPSMNDTSRDEIQIHILEAVDESTVKLVFAVPAFLVGLHGRIELRYTSDQTNNEPSTWEQQILAPPNDLIATKELEFELGGLQPDTTYKIKISVMMHDIDNAPTSPILKIKTLSFVPTTTTLPSIIPKDPDLRAIEVNSTYAKISWRTFSDFELRFIDGVQLRYKEIDDKVYQATPLIHRAVTTYTIEKLKPDSIYEVGIFFIPFLGQTTELQAQRTIEVRTSIENDPYKFDIIMEIHNIKTTSVEIRWSGVPYPEDKFVNIFRAIYQSDGNREDSSSFKVAKRDSPQSILIQDLKPATRYRLWLEAYLTNGRTKKSNVKDFITKLGPGSSTSTSQGKLEGMALMESNSYYGPLVAVSIVATIAIMSTIILLLVLAKKHGTNKAPITTPINRKNNSSAAYDNPTYKTCENNRVNGHNPRTGSIAMTVFPKNHVEKEM